MHSGASQSHKSAKLPLRTHVLPTSNRVQTLEKTATMPNYRLPETVKICDTCNNRYGINRFNSNPKLNTTTCVDCRLKQMQKKPKRHIKAGQSKEELAYNAYIRSAKGRNHVFELSIEEYYAIKALPCTYCGKAGPGGIDRVDNNKGY